MQGTDGFPVGLKVCIELLCLGNSSLGKELMAAIYLQVISDSALSVDRNLAYQLLCQRRSLAKSHRHIHSFQFAICQLSDQVRGTGLSNG